MSRYFVVGLDGTVQRTDSEDIISDFVCCEDYTVIDTQLNCFVTSDTNCIADFALHQIEELK